MVATSVYDREFTFSEKDFHFIRDLISERTGIVLADHKVNMVYGRLSRRLRELNLGSFNDYLSRINFPNLHEFLNYNEFLLISNIIALFLNLLKTKRIKK